MRLRVGRGRLRRWRCGPAVWRRRRRLRRRTPACAFSSWARLGGWQAVGRLYFFRKWFSAETLSGLARVAPDRDSQRVHRAVEWSRSVDSPPPTGVTATGVTPHSLCGTTYLRAYLRLYFYLDCRVSCRILRENSSWYKIYHSLARVPPPPSRRNPGCVVYLGACKWCLQVYHTKYRATVRNRRVTDEECETAE